jgi:hypothetical protein
VIVSSFINSNLISRNFFNLDNLFVSKKQNPRKLIWLIGKL